MRILSSNTFNSTYYSNIFGPEKNAADTYTEN